jgi:hypothetical protein
VTTTFAELIDEVEAAFRAFTSDTSVLFQRGKLALAEHEQQRRIVFVRPGGTVQPSTRAGSTVMVDGTRARMIKRRAERVVAHLFAESEEAAEAMLDNLIAASELTLGTGFQPTQYEWITEDDASAHLKYAEVIQLTAAWHKPVLDTPEPLTVIEGASESCFLGFGDFVPEDFEPADFVTTGEAAH